MRITLKNMPKLALADLLRRRKTTLEHFINESGAQTYASLVNRCVRLGVQPPTEEEYTRVKPVKVSSPSDGVIVLEPIEQDSHESDNKEDQDQVDTSDTDSSSSKTTSKTRRKTKKNKPKVSASDHMVTGEQEEHGDESV